MKVKIEKGVAAGRINAPASKSLSHRLLIAAAMCQGESVISNISLCDDVLATIDCLRAFGVKIDINNKAAKVWGVDFNTVSPIETLNCRESGSTIRFLIPLAMLSGNKTLFTGSERLLSRPFGVYEEIASRCGLLFKQSSVIETAGPLKAGKYQVRADISSQFISGLLFALSLCDGESEIIFTTPPQSRPYIDLTISAMSSFGAKVSWRDDEALIIKGGTRYKPARVSVEGDWSGAAFPEALNHIGGNVIIEGLSDDSSQADKAYIEYFKRLDEGFAHINIEDCPDLAPILFTLAAIKSGAEFTGTKRLKIKESDRAEVMKSELSRLGADIIVDDDRVTVNKTELSATSEVFCGHNDHRIVMSIAVILTLFGGEIDGAEAISKSYPDFFDDLRRLGIKVYEI